MKKSCLLLIALCLLLWGCGTGANYKRIDLTVGETTPPETTDLEAAVGKNTKVKCSAVDLLPDTMPVYRIIPHTVTREEAQQFADYFGVTEELNSGMNPEGNGNVWVRDNTLELSIPQKQDMEMTLSDAQVIEMGEKLLAELTFLPGEYVCEGVTSRRTVTKGDVSYVCYKGLTFYRVLDGVQVRYDDACHIGFTENGVVDLYFTFFDYEKTDEYLPLLSLKDVLPQVLDPEDPDAFDHYNSTYGMLFEKCPGFKGVVLVGESVEFPSKDPRVSPFKYYNNTIDGLPTGKPTPGWFPCVDYPKWLNLLKKSICAYKPDADIVLWTYNWGKCPEADRLALIDNLPEGITLMATFEMFQTKEMDGFRANAVDYTISFPEYSPYFQSEAQRAKERGIRLYTQANSAGLTWDYGVIPYDPFPELWVRRYNSMLEAREKYGLSGVMESHHFGFWPSFISRIEKMMFTQPFSSGDEALKAMAAELYGPENLEEALEAWHLLSHAHTYYPCVNEDQYGPWRVGAAYPFVFHGNMGIMMIEHCENITVRNLSTDWERTYISQGEFVEVADDHIDLRIDGKAYPYKIENERITFIGEGWTAGVHDSYMNIHENPSGEIAYRTRDSHTGNIFKGKAEQIAPDVVRFYGKPTPREVAVKPGQIITLYHGTYITTGFEIGNCKNTLLENITLYHALSTGVYGYRSENITLRKVSATARRDKGRVFSTVADASHFTCCRGEILIDGCAHTGQGDDFINVRGVYSRITGLEDENSLRALRGWFIEAGDTLWYVDHTPVSRREELVVKSKRYLRNENGEDEYLIEFTSPLPSTAKQGNFLENKSWTPSLTIRNCRFEKRNRARGMLVTPPKKVLVENNYFNTAGTAILIEGDLDHWYESGAHTNLIIRNNVFENCSTSGCETGNRWEWGEAPITISPSYRPTSADSPAYHHGITIENNRFLCFDAPVVFARSVDGLRFVGNRLKRTNDYEPFLWQRSNLYLDGCRNVVVKRNRFSRDFPAKLIEIKHMRPTDLKFSQREMKVER